MRLLANHLNIRIKAKYFGNCIIFIVVECWFWGEALRSQLRDITNSYINLIKKKDHSPSILCAILSLLYKYSGKYINAAQYLYKHNLLKR